MRTLIAGFGNVLRGDDGFGVEVIRRLEAQPSDEDVTLLDVGIGGIRLAQELLAGYDRLIVVDAMQNGGPAGQVYVQQVQSVQPAGEVDLHLAYPSRALMVAQALKALPRQVYLVGCEPQETEELIMELSPAVRKAIDVAVMRVRELLVLAESSDG